MEILLSKYIYIGRIGFETKNITKSTHTIFLHKIFHATMNATYCDTLIVICTYFVTYLVKVYKILSLL